MSGGQEPISGAVRAGVSRPLFILGLLLLAAGFQVWMLRNGRIHWNSDQAIVAIMASDILERGVHPVFYYGSSYAGSLEPHWVALFFSVLKPSVAAYRVAMACLLALLSLTVYKTAEAHFGNRAAWFAAAYLALPPWFFLYKGLTSDGAYASTALLGAACVYASLRLEGALRRRRSPGVWLAALGVLAGMGWWVDPLILYFYLAIFAWFALVEPVIFTRLSSYGIFLPAFVVGGFPWWVSNLRWGWKSLRAPELAPVNLGTMLVHLREFWTEGLPILIGSRPVFNRTSSFPAESVASAAIFLIPLSVCAEAIWRQRRHMRDSSHRGESGAARALLLPMLVLLLGIVVVSLNNRADLAEPRFLFPLYAVFPVVFGFAIVRLFRSGAAGRVISSLLLVLTLASCVRGLVGGSSYRAYLDQTNDGSLADVIRELERRDIHSVYASYWVAYRMSFESGERVVATPFGEWSLTRIPRYREAADLDPRPGFVLYGEEAEKFERFLSGRGARYEKAAVGPFRLFLDLDADNLRMLRANGTVPALPFKLAPAA